MVKPNQQKLEWSNFASVPFLTCVQLKSPWSASTSMSTLCAWKHCSIWNITWSMDQWVVRSNSTNTRIYMYIYRYGSQVCVVETEFTKPFQSSWAMSCSTPSSSMTLPCWLVKWEKNGFPFSMTSCNGRESYYVEMFAVPMSQKRLHLFCFCWGEVQVLLSRIM